MRAVMLDRYGDGVEVLSVREAPDPEIGPSDVLVDVHASLIVDILYGILNPKIRVAA